MKVYVCPICGGKFGATDMHYTLYCSQYDTVGCDVCGYEVIPLVTPQEV